MPEPRQLASPPIAEAVIDLRVKLEPHTPLEALDPAVREIAGEYAHREVQRVREILFAFRPESENLTSRRGALGYRLHSGDQHKVVQFRLDGFTFSWLRPYTTWEDLRSSAQRLWSVYARHMQPERIVRTAVRYINHIPLQLPTEELEELFAAPPAIPPGWPQSLHGFLSRVAVRDEATDYVAIITQTIEKGTAPNIAVYLLDIDCFSRKVQTDSPAVWETLGRLRDLKNRIFFNAVTDRLLERFQ